MHLTLNGEATKPAPANVLQQQEARFDAYGRRTVAGASLNGRPYLKWICAGAAVSVQRIRASALQARIAIV